MQKPEKRRESVSRLRKFWKSPKTTSSEDSCESPTKQGLKCLQTLVPPHHQHHTNRPTCSLPLLQVWPSQDSPRGEADGQSFIFSVASDEHVQNDTSFNEQNRRNSLFVEQMQAGDSGIESSPSPIALPLHPIIVTSASDLKNTSSSSSPSTPPHCIQLICSAQVSPTPSTRQQQRRPSSALLHPDHARLFALRQQLSSGDQSSFEDEVIGPTGNFCTNSSSTTSSLTSIAAAAALSDNFKRCSDPWLQRHSTEHADSIEAGAMSDHADERNRRRSSTMTHRYSLFDALDLEYALLRAAARGSVGPYSLSGSIHKLTFTQSLAFPALARRAIGTKRRRSVDLSQRPLDPHESGLNIFAKVVTACVLVMISFLVFLVVYKYTRT